MVTRALATNSPKSRPNGEPCRHPERITFATSHAHRAELCHDHTKCCALASKCIGADFCSSCGHTDRLASVTTLCTGGCPT